MFNAALSRLDVRHICPLPIPVFAPDYGDGVEYPLSAFPSSDPSELLFAVSRQEPHSQQQQQQQTQPQAPAKPRMKRFRPPSTKKEKVVNSAVTAARTPSPVESAPDTEIPLPAELARLLQERIPMVKDGDAPLADPESQESKLLAQQQPNKKYSCTQYSAEFVAWLDRVCLGLYEMLEKRPIVTDATGKDREEFARVTEQLGLTMPLDMRCTGCRRRFKIKTWRETTDNSVQKCMTHFPESTRASHCLRCRVVDWVLADRPTASNQHPARLTVIPVASSDEPPPPPRSDAGEKKKRKRNKKSPPTAAAAAADSGFVKQEEIN